MTKDLTSRNNQIVIQETAESVLIVAALGDISAGTHASAEFFNKNLQENSPARVSRQTIWHWANGSKCVSDARVRYWKLAFAETDARHQLAVAIMSYRDQATQAHWVGKPAVPAVEVVSKPRRRLKLGRDF